MTPQKISKAASYDIVLADDHRLFRQGLKRFLNHRPGLKVVGEASDGQELLELLKKRRPRMVILDISMPHMNGIEATYEIVKSHPEISVFFLTIHKNPEYVRQAISAGARGYLLKDEIDTEMFRAIEAIKNGDVYFPESHP
jgi:DNA-binding NarL/FixJ family response regulator